MTHPLSHPDEGPPELELDPAHPTEVAVPNKWKARIRWGILVLGLAGMVLVARETLAHNDEADELPAVTAALAAMALFAASAASAARAWVALLGRGVKPAEARGSLYLSQLGKYVPGGGLVQAAGQVTLTATEDLPVRRVALAWASSIALTVVASATLATGLVTATSLPLAVRLVALCGPLSLVVLDRRLLSWLLVQARRLVKRIPEPDLLPTQAEINKAFLWSLANVALNAASFTVLLVNIDASLAVRDVFSSFTAGWVAGFLVAPLPAGLGLREGVLLGLLPGTSTGLLLTASLTQRAMALIAELLLAGGNRVTRWIAGR